MYTCIAYLSEIRKFCSKNVAHKGVNFEAQNALEVTYQQASRQQGHAKPASSRSGGPSERSKDTQNQPRVGPVDQRCFIQDIKSIL